MNETDYNVLQRVPIGALATVNEDGTALVTPLHFAVFGQEIVWVSDREAQHSHNLERREVVEFAVWNEQKQAVYLRGVPRKITEDELADVREAYREKLADFMPEFAHPQFYAMSIGEYNPAKSTEDWRHFRAE